MKADVLIKNGRLIDPANGIDRIGHVAIRGRKIIALENTQSAMADVEVDATDCIVVPGLIDYHCHANFQASDVGIPPDIAMLPKGVTAFVDCGSVGVSNCRAYLETLSRCIVKSRIYLNISPLGLSTREHVEQINPSSWRMEKFEELFDQFPDKILGFKMRLNRSVMGQCGMEGFYAMLKVAEHFHKPVLVHPSDPLSSAGEILNALRPGDVFCHCYHGKGSSIIQNGHVIEEAKAARSRGVIFDVAHGTSNFDFHVAQAAIHEQFFPDMISTDLSLLSFNKQPVGSLTQIMSKLMLLGMPLYDVIRCVTATPAAMMHMEREIGQLSPGTSGDITILKMVNIPVDFYDTKKNKRQGSNLLLPVGTVASGMLVYEEPLLLARQAMN